MKNKNMLLHTCHMIPDITAASLSIVYGISQRTIASRQIHIWSDGGRHFRSLEVLRCLLDNPFPETSGATINVNYFCPYHGKSEVDTVFGLFARVLKFIPLDGIRTIEQLCSYLHSSCERFQHRDSKKYTFKMFAQTLFFYSDALSIFLCYN